ncbi:hypothetical protein EHQ53_05900 [Leptospira langatensis]|uniref:EF-hand domain-containing protein n=1 Tax=Leptospira langatensis TaxID=2484983 RepID=A0A5F1ZVT0_9LEPT|nr:hypothetical protein [Leptospira langatensis]TGK02996.1 hypothetical protein EHO57_06735 [Leptospira langatensis]TGL41751.1 hypothetical protein EHQ53_05900 [Leptospira langatensis]
MPETESNSPQALNPVPEEGIVPLDRTDLIPEEELRNLLLQTNPKAMRDLDMIEKGVENFFLFNYSPFALAKYEQLQFLKPADLKYFEDKNGFVLYQYLFLSEETRELGLANVAIRPASRRADQIQKIKSACLAQSAAAFLQYIARRDLNLAERRSAGELRDWVLRQYLNTDEKGNPVDFQDSKNLPISMRNVKTLSVESFLQRNFKLRDDILASLISLLGKKPNEIIQFLSQIKADPEALLVIEKRGSRSPLLRLHLEFHVIQPSLEELVGDTLDVKKETATDETEIEIIYEVFINLGRRILTSLLPGEQSGWIQPSGTHQGAQFIQELKKHPAFTSGKTWEGSDVFLQAFEVLSQSMDSLSSLRKESLVNLAFSDIVVRVRESKEPFSVDLSSIKLKDSSIKKSGLSKAEVLDQVLERFKTRNDILTREKATGNSPGIVALAIENVVSSFLANKERRTSIHTLIRKNGQAKGIYAFLKDVVEGVDSEIAIDEQIRLSKAITDWEKENEKQRLKAIQDSKSFLVKLLEWILSLFGVSISSPLKKDLEPADEYQSAKQSKKASSPKSAEPAPEKEAPKQKKSLGVLMGPKEKSTLIPAKVQKSIDYVDRKNNGIIWLDEVVAAIASPEFGKDKVADLMYYDQKRRYIEIRSMNSIRHVFIRKELESDSAWLDSTLEYLENVTAKKPEFAALADTLRKFRDE